MENKIYTLHNGGGYICLIATNEQTGEEVAYFNSNPNKAILMSADEIKENLKKFKGCQTRIMNTITKGGEQC